MKTKLLALTIATLFSLPAFAAPAQVDLALANQNTENLITSQMTGIDASVQSKLDSQAQDIAVVDDTVYEKQSDGTWAAVGAASAALVAGILSSSSSSSSSDDNLVPELPIERNPGHLPQDDASDGGWDNLPPGIGENPMVPFTHNGIDFVLDTTTGLITKDGVVVASVERDGYITGTVTDHASGNTYKIWKDANGINVDWVNSEIDNGFEVTKPAPELPTPDADNPIHDNPEWSKNQNSDGSYTIYRDDAVMGNVKKETSEDGRTNMTVVSGNNGGVVVVDHANRDVFANDQAKETIKSIAKQPRFDKVSSKVQSRIN